MGCEAHIAVAFKDNETVKEILAVYATDPIVQEQNALKEWHVVGSDENILYFKHANLRWHSHTPLWASQHSDVQAVTHMMHLARNFHKERGIPFAYYYVRIGDEFDDLEEDYVHSGEDDAHALMHQLLISFTVHRYVDVNF